MTLIKVLASLDKDTSKVIIDMDNPDTAYLMKNEKLYSVRYSSSQKKFLDEGKSFKVSNFSKWSMLSKQWEFLE